MDGPKVLVINAGSSSIKFAIYLIPADSLLIKGHIDRLGSEQCTFKVDRFYAGPTGIGEVVEQQPFHLKDVKHAIPFILDYLLKEGILKSLDEIVAVGHRVVHGADKYNSAALINAEVKQNIRHLSKYAPLHNPHNLVGIERCEKLLKGVHQVAVFDTAFHQSMPNWTYLYGIDPDFYAEHGIRKYGFHGTSHKYCSLKATEFLGFMPKRMITCHLGNGSSITAIKNGLSVDTSMGFTPTDGLIMGTRSGAIDPEVILYLLRELKQKPEKIDQFLNKESGLKSIAGSGDVRDIWNNARHGDQQSALALDMLSYEIARYIGGYAATLNGLDCLVFTAGIGENAWYVRAAVCANLSFLGLQIDEDKNQRNHHDITGPDSIVKVFVIPANEELQIAREAAQPWKDNQ